jgi:Ser/Thr protein kinase RdoA (MazF antagonist)
VRELYDHLRERYGIEVSELRELDLDVWRVSRLDGPSWIARVFPAERPRAAVAGDAEILTLLERGGFPAERCAHAEPVSELAGRGVLVTELVKGTRAPGGKRTFVVLGELLGRLHAATAERALQLRPGGAWHHVHAQGSPAEEPRASAALLEAATPPRGAGERLQLAALREALLGADTGAGLPEALLHPDFVPANALQNPEGKTVLVDWTGAGSGPRLWTLAFLLWAAAARDLALAQAVVARYARHVTLLPEERARLAEVAQVRPLVLSAWAYCHRRGAAGELGERVQMTRSLARALSAAVEQTLETL